MAKINGRKRSRGKAKTGVSKANTRAHVPVSERTAANHPVGPGAGVHRGDRRDTNPVFTNNERRQPNLSNPRGSGKAQIQAGGKSRTGGGKRQKGTYDH